MSARFAWVDDAVAAGQSPATIVGTAARRAGHPGLASVDALPEAAGLDVPGPVRAADLGWIHERALDADRRHRDGVHYTPAGVTRRLAELTVGTNRSATVCDPAVGGGAFLLAAADHLRALGVDPAEIVGERLWGIDVDPVAVAVSRVALELWAAEQGVETCTPAAHVVCADTLEVGAAAFDRSPGFDVVLGNPPFQNQLGRSTARSAATSSALRDRWSVHAGPYADTAAWFIPAGLELAAPGGVVAFVEPQSLLVAADAAALRALATSAAELEGLWWGGRDVFAADVAVCAPILRRLEDGEATSPDVPVARWEGPDVVAVEPAQRPDGPSWGPLVADLLGAPPVTPVAAGTVADMATATAGFRDEYYAVTSHLSESPEGDDPRLLTVGMIDPLHDRWGSTSFRIARAAWHHPRVDMAALAADTPRIADWVHDRLVPKVLVATQTKVVEALVDTRGDMVPSTPVVAVHCARDRLWHLAAALVSPVASAVAFARVAGAALSSQTIKLSAKQVLELPLPPVGQAWDAGAAAARQVAEAGSAGERLDRLAVLGRAMNDAYDVDDAQLLHWWLDRQPRRA